MAAQLLGLLLVQQTVHMMAQLLELLLAQQTVHVDVNI